MMNGELRPYEEYEKIELPWLSEIPRGWTIKRGKQLFKMVDERTSTGGEELLSVSASYGVVKRKNTNVTMFKAASYVGYKLCWEKDLVVNSLWAWQQGLGFSKYHGIISTAYSVYRLRSEKENSKYFDYLLRSDSYLWELRTRSKGIWKSRYQLHDSSFMDMPFIIPPRPEQDQIVKYLDHKLAKINKFIKAKKKLIAALKEQKQAIINQAVTKGLDSKVRMKPSGIEWLGDIPEHWDILMNRRIFKENSRPFSGNEETVLSLSQKEGIIPYERMKERSLHTSTYENWKLVYPNDLVLNRFKAHLGVFFSSELRGIVTFHYGVYEPIKKLNSKYYEHLYHTNIYRAVYAGRSNGMTIGLQNLSNQNFYNVYTLFPPFKEQNQIVEYIDKEVNKCDTIISRIEKEIQLITDYKNSLISEVVMGKVDVRHVAINELEEMDLDEPEIDEELNDEGELDTEEGDE